MSDGPPTSIGGPYFLPRLPWMSAPMKLTVLAFADSANIAEGSKLNIFGIFDTIFTPAVPTTHPEMAIAMRFAVSPSDRGRSHDLQLKLVAPNGTAIVTGNAQVTIQESPVNRDVHHFDQVVKIPGVQFPEAGTYRLEVLVNGRKAGHILLAVHLLEPA